MKKGHKTKAGATANNNELSNMEIALFALFKRGGISKKVHTEDISWEAYNLAKERFSWRLPEYRDKGFPDKTPVRYALEQAKKKENGKLVSGRAGGDIGGSELEGWQFTPAGALWIKENEERISNALNQKAPLLPPHEVERFLKKIRQDPSFEHFLRDRNLSTLSYYAFTDMLSSAPDAPRDIVKRKFESLLSTAEIIGDKEILSFLKTCESRFLGDVENKIAT